MPIFYFNCEHICGFNELSWIFNIKKNYENKNFITQIIHTPFLGSRKVPQKLWARSVRFDVYWIQTDKQTHKKSLNIEMAYPSWCNMIHTEVLIHLILWVLLIWTVLLQYKYASSYAILSSSLMIIKLGTWYRKK